MRTEAHANTKNKKNDSVWFPFGIEDDPTRKKIFCFCHAGASSVMFKDYMKQTQIQFIPIELPGRGTRVSDPFITNIQTMTEQISEAIAKGIDDNQFVLYGHSMGALLAFTTAYRLERNYSIKAERLVVSGRQAPPDPDVSLYRTDMGKSALIAELKRLNGISEEVFENKELLDFILPIITSDYQLIESYQYKGEIVSIPILAYSASCDKEADFNIMSRWKSVTTNSFQIREEEGDHFFYIKRPAEFLSRLVPALLSENDQQN